MAVFVLASQYAQARHAAPGPGGTRRAIPERLPGARDLAAPGAGSG